MKRFAPYSAFVLLISIVLTESAISLDWPQWQGPDRDAISKETGLLQEWPAEGPPLAWRTEGIGAGMGGIAVAGGRIYTTGDIDGTAWLFALDEATGDRLWQQEIGRGGQLGFMYNPAGPRATPTVDGDRLYILSQHGELVCFTTDGEEVWRTNYVEDHGGIVPTWGYAESPLVDGDKIICTPGGDEATLMALDKMSGETIWTCKVPDRAAGEDSADGNAGRGRGGRGRGRRGFGRGGPESGANYASAIAIDFAGERQYVQVTAHSLVGVSAQGGKLLWRYDRPVSHIACSTPIYRDGLVFAASAYEGGAGAVRLSKDASGEVTAEEVYFTTRMQNHHGGMIVVDGCLYGAHGGNSGGFLTCLDFQTGEVLWRDRQVPKGSLAFADGRLYFRCEDVNGEDPAIILIEPNREELIERGRFQQPDRSRSEAWTHPVIANGKLYIRDQDLLLCYDVQAK